MKTASLGLLEVMVVRVNAGGGMPPHFILLEVQSATRLLGPTKGISTGGKWRAFCLDFSRSTTQDLRTQKSDRTNLVERYRTFDQIRSIGFQSPNIRMRTFGS